MNLAKITLHKQEELEAMTNFVNNRKKPNMRHGAEKPTFSEIQHSRQLNKSLLLASASAETIPAAIRQYNKLNFSAEKEIEQEKTIEMKQEAAQKFKRFNE